MDVMISLSASESMDIARQMTVNCRFPSTFERVPDAVELYDLRFIPVFFANARKVVMKHVFMDETNRSSGLMIPP